MCGVQGVGFVFKDTTAVGSGLNRVTDRKITPTSRPMSERGGAMLTVPYIKQGCRISWNEGYVGRIPVGLV